MKTKRKDNDEIRQNKKRKKMKVTEIEKREKNEVCNGNDGERMSRERRCIPK